MTLSARSCRFFSSLFSTFTKAALLCCVLLSCSFLADAQQSLGPVNGSTSTPIPGAGHDYLGDLVDTVNPANGSLSIRINTPVPQGRGLTVPFSFNYDSAGVIQPFNSGTSSAVNLVSHPGFLASGGWTYGLPRADATWVLASVQLNGKQAYCAYTTSFVFSDGKGTRHDVDGAYVATGQQACSSNGYQTVNLGGDSEFPASVSSGSLTGIDNLGNFYSFPYFTPPGTGGGPPCSNGQSGDLSVGLASLPTSIEDRNGNLVTFSLPASPNSCDGAFTESDTLGRTAISSSGFGATGNAVTISGLQKSYQLTWGSTPAANAPIGTNFIQNIGGCQAFIGWTGSLNTISAIELPNSQSFTFTYDPTYGLLNQVTYPSGAYVSYTWENNPLSEIYAYRGQTQNGTYDCEAEYDTFAISHRYVYNASHSLILQQDFSYAPTTWCSSSCTGWATKQTTVKTTDYISGLVTSTVYIYSPMNVANPPFVYNSILAQIPVESQELYQNSSGTTLRTINKKWNDPFELTQEQTVLEDQSTTSETDYVYGGDAGQLLYKYEYDFGQGSRGNLLRESAVIYQAFTSGHPGDRPCQTITYDGAGNPYAETDTYYDSGATGTVCGAAGTPSVGNAGASTLTGHDPAYNYNASSQPQRGNATTVIKKCFQGATSCTDSRTTYAYDETGQRTSSTDPCGNGTCSDVSGSQTTSYSFGDSFLSTNTGSFTTTGGSPPGGMVTNAYLTKVTYPITGSVNHIETFTYGYNDGELTTSIDQNSKTTTYRYNDNFGRPTETDFPDGGQTTLQYNDAGASPSVTTTKLVLTGTNIVSTAATDGMGHVTTTQLTSDPDGATYTSSKVYDGHFRVYQSYNPYRSTGDSTYGITTNTYDALGRVIKVQDPDNSYRSTAYSLNLTTVSDEVGNQRVSHSDALGRLTEVDEPANVPNSPATATITISGSMKSVPIPPTAATGNVVISGSLRSQQICQRGGQQCETVYDEGTVTITVNGHSDSVNYAYGGNSTSTSVAAALAGAINGDSSAPATATVSGSTVYLTSKIAGTSGNNDPLLASSATTDPLFTGTSFPASPSGSSLTGGQNTSTLYDSGTVSADVNGCATSVPYSESGNNSAASVASALAASLGSTCSVDISASASGDVITLTTRLTGPNADNYTLSANSASSNPGTFSPPSFAASAGVFTGGGDAGLNTPAVTSYTYDPLSDLTAVTQNGSNSAYARVRNFSYDSLTRLTSSSNPESGTITYTYDLNGNVATKVAPKPNAGSTGTVTTNFTYDALNRLTQKSFTGLTLAAEQYGYDGKTLSSCGTAPPTITSPTNLIGRRSSMCSGYSGSSWSYDVMGRTLLETTINAGGGSQPQNSIGYSYYLDGSLKAIIHPSGNTVTYTVGGAGRTTQLSDSSGNQYASAISYAPQGAVATMTSGSGIVSSNTYNNRLQPVSISAGLSGQTPVLSLCYDFHLAVAFNKTGCNLPASTTGNNGNVFQVLNNLDSTRSTAFSYDNLNRIAQANTINTTSANCWGETYTIDAWGNLTNRGSVAGMSGGCSYEALSASVNTNNQLSILQYDPAGNVVNDGNGNAPTYDAENRIASDAGVTYFYDTDGMRTEKSSGTKYWYGPGGQVLMETALNGTVNEEYIYLNGERVARVDRPSGTVNYYFSDNIGSASVITGATGTIQEQYYYYPYGGLVASTGSDPNHYKFTGKERDSESNLDNFGARYYTSSIGRFMTPDWAARATAVPYAKFGDPQTLNLYSYVENAPVNRADADGHYAGFEYQLSGTGGFDAGSMEFTENSDIGSGVQTTVAQLVAQLNQNAQLQAQNKNTVTVTVDQVKSNQPFGHATISVGGDKPVGLVPNSDAKAAAAVAVEAKTGVPTSVPGHIAEDNRKPEAQATIQVTPDQAKAMRAYITQAEHAKQDYDPGFRNCAHFAEEVLRSGGVKAPYDMTPGGLVGDLQKQNQ
jgi:RHS repeat-associated protein